MKSSIFEHSGVETWRIKHPREWWAYQNLDDDDELRDRVLAAVLNNREDDQAIDDLICFAEALEAHQRASKSGTIRLPPAVGERRSFPLIANRMTPMSDKSGLFYRVAFFSPDGWGGFFDTTNPSVVERISRVRDHAKPLTVVGEVSRRRYEFFVELDYVKIV